jgi:hypothetical protein
MIANANACLRKGAKRTPSHRYLLRVCRAWLLALLGRAEANTSSVRRRSAVASKFGVSLITYEELRNHEAIVGWTQIVVGLFIAGTISVLWVSAAKLASLVRATFIPGLIAMYGKPIAIFLITVAIIDIVGAVALLRHQSWGRALMIAVGIAELPIFPIGTVVGAYTLWALWLR